MERLLLVLIVDILMLKIALLKKMIMLISLCFNVSVAHIFNTKGKALNGTGTANDINAASSESAELLSLGLKVDGVGDEINDFLDNTTFLPLLLITQV